VRGTDRRSAGRARRYAAIAAAAAVSLSVAACGWTEWFLTFSQYLRGSALGKAVEAGPHGSRFVGPASLPPDTATAPLGTSETGNYDAGTANISG
jgi:hypothetical protein